MPKVNYRLENVAIANALQLEDRPTSLYSRSGLYYFSQIACCAYAQTAKVLTLPLDSATPIS